MGVAMAFYRRVGALHELRLTDGPLTRELPEPGRGAIAAMRLD